MEKKTLTFEVKLREKKDKKSNDFMPGVIYGRGFENIMVWIDHKKFKKLYREIGESTIFELSVEGKKQPQKVLIYDIQSDPISGEFSHIDFYRVRMDEKIQTDVALDFIGVSPAVKELGGVFVQNMDEIEVRCLPEDLPSSIPVDISVIKTFEDHILVKDLKVDEKVEIIIDPETAVALVSAPRSEKELEELQEEVDADISKVEKVDEDKEEGDGEADGEAGAEAEQKTVDEEEKTS